MKKTLTSVLALFVAASVSAAVDGTATWTVGDENAATLTAEIEDAVLETGVKVGTDLTVSTYDATNNGGGTLATYQPATSNAGCVETDMIEYTVKMKKGMTIAVANVVFDAVKQGTDNAFFSWSYVCDEVESEIVAYSDPKTQILRNNNANSDVAPLTHDEAINCAACRTFKLRFYISDVANNKKMSIGNIRINGTVDGEAEGRAFTDFKVDFRTDPYTVLAPETGLPEGVTITGTFHDTQHGYSNTLVTVPVDGPVRFTVGGCGYSNQATVADAEGNVLATLDTRAAGCDSNTSFDHFVTWTYNSEEPATLTLNLGNYCPFLYAEASELIPMCTVRYYDVDGKTIIGEEEVEGGSALKFAYGAENVTVAEGYKFRGWFNSTQSSAVKIAEGISVQENLNLYAKATEIEVPTNTSRYIYELNKVNFYIEDHEAIWNNGGSFHDTQHGWAFSAGNSLSIAVAGKAIISVGNCRYSAEGAEAVVTNEAGETVATFPVKVENDGAEATFKYDSDKADVLTITFGGTSYIHKVSVYNVVDFVEYDEATGYYFIPANDANSFLIALASANATGNAKIFLPNGTYDLGDLVLTQISGNNISIIGESMEGTILVNAPSVEIEGIGTTATLLNTSDNLYLQDLTIQNALEYYKSGSAGRAVCLQDKGANTIQKNVKMLSYQDTYYSNRASNRYWEDSEIHGTVDYLCGDGNVVYKRVALVNESRSATGKSGEDVIAAPNCTSSTEARKNYGYVFLDCTVKSECNAFTFARSWGGESTCYWINTQVLDNSLAASRWTTAGMNIAAYCFKEYNTTDAEGNVTTPASNVVTFTHNTGNLEYETVLTAEEAAALTTDNIFGEWKPEQYTAQFDAVDFFTDGKTLIWSPSEGAQGYAIVKDGAIVTILGADATSYDMEEEGTYELRVANLRGGFGAPATPKDIVSIESVEVAPQATEVTYNLFGQRINDAKGICIANGKKVVK
ncbi:MAG: hypothetical protein IKX25_04000 [Bacteroidales bacterium]|nr:hypothetical protein [Bacteroidales bacterium]